MIFVSLLATMGMITLAKASSMSYATYRRRELPLDERPELLFLYDQKDPQNTDTTSKSVYMEPEFGNEIILHSDMSEIPNDSTISTIERKKKLGLRSNSLSIVNPVDVLRERVLLELSRRKAMQDQRQVDANRRMLETIGKRSGYQLVPEFTRSLAQSKNINNHVYTNDRLNDARNEQHRTYAQPIPDERRHDWYDFADSIIRGNGDDETRKVLSTYHNDRQ